MTGDPRQADTGAAQALLHQATVLKSGAVRLPAMTAAELCVLGAMTTSLIDAGAWSWWTSAPPGRRAVLREMAWQFLAYRQLVTSEPAGREATGPGRVRVAPPAALIVAGRTRPAFIVLCRPGPTGEPEQTRMYGIGDQQSGVRTVLIEDAKTGPAGWAGPAYEFGLTSPVAAGRALARWAASPGPAPAGPASAGPDRCRLIDIHSPAWYPGHPARVADHRRGQRRKPARRVRTEPAKRHKPATV